MAANSLIELQATENKADDIIANRALIDETVIRMNEGLASGEFEPPVCPVEHRFSPGLYLRQVTMPAGAAVIGKIHSTEHFNIVLTGKCTVITAEGIEEITAPHTFISKAGVKKVVIVHEECIWQTTHVTESTDLEEIEKQVIVESYDNLLDDGLLKNLKRLGL
jgi:hypothetical protein